MKCGRCFLRRILSGEILLLGGMGRVVVRTEAKKTSRGQFGNGRLFGVEERKRKTDCDCPDTAFFWERTLVM